MIHPSVPNHFNHVWLFATLWTVAHQAPQSMRFSRQEYWSGLPSPSPGDLPNPWFKPVSPTSPALQADSLPTESLGKTNSKAPPFFLMPVLELGYICQTLGMLACSPGFGLPPTSFFTTKPLLWENPNNWLGQQSFFHFIDVCAEAKAMLSPGSAHRETD